MESLETEIASCLSMLQKENEKTKNDSFSFYNLNLANISSFLSSTGSTQRNLSLGGKILQICFEKIEDC